MSRRPFSRAWLPFWALLLACFATLPAQAEELQADRTEFAVGETVNLKIPGAFSLVKPKWRAIPAGIVQFTDKERTEAKVKGVAPGKVQVTATVDLKLVSTTYEVSLCVKSGTDLSACGKDDTVKDDPGAVRLMGLMRGMGFPDKQTRIARLLYEVTNEIRGADSFYAELAKIPAKMTDVIEVRTTLVDMPDSSLARQVMGPRYPEGGTLVEQRILTWRKLQTLGSDPQRAGPVLRPRARRRGEVDCVPCGQMGG